MIGILGGALVATATLTPSWGAERFADPSSAPVVGGFGVGDGLEASIDERDGALAFDVPAGGLQLRWESRAPTHDRYGFGPRWSLGVASVDVLGGVRVAPSSGGVFEADATQPSGLRGYDTDDVLFTQEAGTVSVPSADEVGFAFALHELGGVVTYFNAVGDPVARRDAGEAWTVWEWATDAPHRLHRIVGPEGIVTELNWLDPGVVRVRPGANVTVGDAESGVGGEWVIDVDGGRVIAVTDPLGARVDIAYTRDGLVSVIGADSGARTTAEWASGIDAVPRVSRLRTHDQSTGELLSERTWEMGSAPTGWPVAADGVPATGYSTTLSDGATRVESEFNSLHQLIRRALHGSGPGGSRVLQEQRLHYPGTDENGVPTAAPGALPKSWSRPTSTESISFDAAGGQRIVRESSTFDEFGRMVEHTGADGTVTEMEFDEVVPDERRLPVGLPLVERTRAPDGAVTELRRTMNAWRTGPATLERWNGPDESSLSRVGYVEYQSDPDGFVTGERVFPNGDPGTIPSVSTRERAVDRDAGAVDISTTAGRGNASRTETAKVSLVHGATLAETDSAGRTTTYDFDLSGRLIGHTDGAGRQTATRYESQTDDRRNAVTVTTPDGVERTEIRDALGRVRAVLDNIDRGRVSPGYARQVERREYPAPGEVRIIDAWGAVTTQRQDVLGRTVAVESPTGLTQVVEYDDVAGIRRTAMTPTGVLADAAFIAEERVDESGRPIESTGIRADARASPRVETRFDGFGRPVATTDGVLDSLVDYDVAGNAISTTIAPSVGESSVEHTAVASGSLRAERSFDGFGTSVEKVLSSGEDGADARSGGRRTLDELGRVRAEADQLGRTSSFAYTPDGLVERADMGSGQVREREYHPETRQVIGERVSSPAGESVDTAYEYDVMDRPVAVFDPSTPEDTRISYQYDAHGNVLTVTYPDGAEIRHEYDEHGRKDATTDVAGNRSEFRYDAAGRLREVAQSTTEGHLAQVAYDYDDYGRIERVVHGNGLVIEYAFTSVSEIERESATVDGRPVSERTYAYDARGNLIERTDTRTAALDGGVPADQPTSETTAYDYDIRDRLVGSTVHAGDSVEAPLRSRVEYELTVSGDVAVERTVVNADASSSESTRSFEYGPTGELTAVTTQSAEGGDAVRTVQQYDESGSLVRDIDGVEYRYDAANRLHAEVTPDGEVTRTSYWPDGSRRARLHERSGRSETYYWDGDTLINDVHVDPGDDANSGTAAYLLGGIRHARTSSTADASAPVRIEYLMTDRHGSVTELIDGAGALTSQYDYTDYGEATIDATPDVPRVDGLARNPFQFAGEFTDASGHQYLRARMYHPDLMRFSSLDVLPFHNKAAYADANPIMNVDPSGHAAQKDWLYVGLAALGIALSLFGLVGAAGTSAAALGFAVFATVVDVAFTTAEVINRVDHEFMSKDWAEGLGWASLGLGFAAAAFGTAAEIVHRASRSYTLIAPGSAPAPAPAPVAKPKPKPKPKPRRAYEDYNVMARDAPDADTLDNEWADWVKKTFKALANDPGGFEIDDWSYGKAVEMSRELITKQIHNPVKLVSRSGLGLPSDLNDLIVGFAGLAGPAPAAVKVAQAVNTYLPTLVKSGRVPTRLWVDPASWQPPLITDIQTLIRDSRRVLGLPDAVDAADGDPPPSAIAGVGAGQYE